MQRQIWTVLLPRRLIREQPAAGKTMPVKSPCSEFHVVSFQKAFPRD